MVRILLAILCLWIVPPACGLIGEEMDERDKSNYITFSDSAFERACLKAGDFNEDGRISRYEALRVLHLSCSDAGIASLDGIEAFENLRTLDCARNELVSLDVSRNVLLERLDCSSNSLQRCTLGSLRLLKELRCNANRLTLLDVTGCTALETLDCGNNTLYALEVSRCAQIMELLYTRDNAPLDAIYVAQRQFIRDLTTDSHTSVIVR